LSRVQAAEYMGVGVTKWDEMVLDGRMPQPMIVDGRLVWDRVEIDAAISDLPRRGQDNPWKGVAA
jgi:hypothetical protein